MLIILYPIDFRIIFSKFLVQPGPPKCSFLATPLKVREEYKEKEPTLSLHEALATNIAVTVMKGKPFSFYD